MCVCTRECHSGRIGWEAYNQGCCIPFSSMHAQSLSHVPLFATPWMDCKPPGSSAHGIFQARILEHVAISYSKRSSQPRDWTHISCVGMWIFFITSATWSMLLFPSTAVCRIPPSCHLSYHRITLELRNSLCLLKPMSIRTVFSSYCIKFWHFISLKTFVLEQYSMEKRISYSLLQSYRFFVSLKVWRTHYLAHFKQTIILKTIDIK